MQPDCWGQVRMAGNTVDEGEGYTLAQVGLPRLESTELSGQATYRLSSKQRGHSRGEGAFSPSISIPASLTLRKWDLSSLQHRPVLAQPGFIQYNTNN